MPDLIPFFVSTLAATLTETAPDTRSTSAAAGERFRALLFDTFRVPGVPVAGSVEAGESGTEGPAEAPAELPSQLDPSGNAVARSLGEILPVPPAGNSAAPLIETVSERGSLERGPDPPLSGPGFVARSTQAQPPRAFFQTSTIFEAPSLVGALKSATPAAIAEPTPLEQPQLPKSSEQPRPSPTIAELSPAIRFERGTLPQAARDFVSTLRDAKPSNDAWPAESAGAAQRLAKVIHAVRESGSLGSASPDADPAIQRGGTSQVVPTTGRETPQLFRESFASPTHAVPRAPGVESPSTQIPPPVPFAKRVASPESVVSNEPGALPPKLPAAAVPRPVVDKQEPTAPLPGRPETHQGPRPVTASTMPDQRPGVAEPIPSPSPGATRIEPETQNLSPIRHADIPDGNRQATEGKRPVATVLVQNRVVPPSPPEQAAQRVEQRSVRPRQAEHSPVTKGVLRSHLPSTFFQTERPVAAPTGIVGTVTTQAEPKAQETPPAATRPATQFSKASDVVVAPVAEATALAGGERPLAPSVSASAGLESSRVQVVSNLPVETTLPLAETQPTPLAQNEALAQVILAKAKVMTRPGVAQLQFTLVPQDLGTVRVRIETRGDRLSVKLVASTASAVESLNLGLSRLVAQLQSSGVSQPEVSLGVETSADPGMQGEHPCGSGSRRSDEPHADARSPLADEPLERDEPDAASRGRLDRMA